MTIKSVVADYEADLEYANPIYGDGLGEGEKGKIGTTSHMGLCLDDDWMRLPQWWIMANLEPSSTNKQSVAYKIVTHTLSSIHLLLLPLQAWLCCSG